MNNKLNKFKPNDNEKVESMRKRKTKLLVAIQSKTKTKVEVIEEARRR